MDKKEEQENKNYMSDTKGGNMEKGIYVSCVRLSDEYKKEKEEAKKEYEQAVEKKYEVIKGVFATSREKFCGECHFLDDEYNACNLFGENCLSHGSYDLRVKKCREMF